MGSSILFCELYYYNKHVFTKISKDNYDDC